VWLSPVQAVIMTITDRLHGYAGELSKELRHAGLRVEEDFRNEKIGFKIREARNQKVPYMIIIGDKESESRTLALRKRGEDKTSVLSVEEFLALFHQEVKERS
jgi:threonyl-tRNA synthetase